MEYEYEIQTLEQVQNINNRKETQNIINNKIDNFSDQILETSNIENQLNIISDTLNELSISDFNTEEITDKIEAIDIQNISAQNQDILLQLKEQQEKINKIEELLNKIIDNMG